MLDHHTLVPFFKSSPSPNAQSAPGTFFASSSLRLGSFTALGASLEDLLPVFVELEFRDDDFAGVDADGDGLAVGLLAGDSLDVDEVLQSVNGGDFAFTALVGASHDGDFVVFSDGDAVDIVLFP